MISEPLSVLLIACVSFTASAVAVPSIIERCKERGFMAEDAHRRVKVPYLGGLGILLGFLSGMAVTGFLGGDPEVCLASTLSGALGGLLGLSDDLFRLSKRDLVLLSTLAGVPVVSFRIGNPYVYMFGKLDLGIVFWTLVPLGFCYLMNAVNIYAGFNGMEAGCGLVTSTSLMICSMIYGSWNSALELAALSGALGAFLLWNRYPARIFPGNSGTYLIGAVRAAAIVAGTIEAAGLIATMPYFINFLIRLKNRFRWTVGYVDEKGLIRTRGLEALWSLWIGRGSSEERIFWKAVLFQALFGVGAIIFSYISC